MIVESTNVNNYENVKIFQLIINNPRVIARYLYKKLTQSFTNKKVELSILKLKPFHLEIKVGRNKIVIKQFGHNLELSINGIPFSSKKTLKELGKFVKDAVTGEAELFKGIKKVKSLIKSKLEIEPSIAVDFNNGIFAHITLEGKINRAVKDLYLFLKWLEMEHPYLHARISAQRRMSDILFFGDILEHPSQKFEWPSFKKSLLLSLFSTSAFGKSERQGFWCPINF